MLNILNWSKPLKVNGVLYNNSEEAYTELKDFDGEITIELNVEDNNDSNIDNNLDSPVINHNEKFYRFEITKWFARRVHKCPPILDGYIDMETDKAIKITAKGLVEKSVCCCMCGRELTNKNSKLIGIGPICASNIGFTYNPEDIADIERVQQEMEEKLYEFWIPKTQVNYYEIEE